jgi:hypothetical protein
MLPASGRLPSHRSLEIGSAGPEVDVEGLALQHQGRDRLHADRFRVGKATPVGAEVHNRHVQAAGVQGGDHRVLGTDADREAAVREARSAAALGAGA